MSDQTFKDPTVFTVVHTSEPGFQINCAVFKKEEDAIQAGFAIVKENSSIYKLDANALIQEKGEYVFEEWHTLTSHRERIQVFQNPVNVINNK